MSNRDILYESMKSSRKSSLIPIIAIINANKKRKLTKSKNLKYKHQSSFQVYLDWCPYAIFPNVEDLITLNLYLNAKYQYAAWLFMKRRPYQITQIFNPKSESVDLNVKKTLDIIICGIMHRFEEENKVIVPNNIPLKIRQYIEVGAAQFHCAGYNNPRFKPYQDYPMYTPEDPTISFDNPNESPNIPEAWYGI